MSFISSKYKCDFCGALFEGERAIEDMQRFYLCTDPKTWNHGLHQMIFNGHMCSSCVPAPIKEPLVLTEFKEPLKKSLLEKLKEFVCK